MLARPPRLNVHTALRVAYGCALLFLMTCAGFAAGRQVMHGHVPPAVGGLAPEGRLDPAKRMHLALSLPPRDPAALSQLLSALYDPASPRFRQFITPQQFAAQFGPSEQDYAALIAFAQTSGLKVTAMHPNRVILDVEGTVTDIERTFHVTLKTYQHPSEGRTFHAPDAEPSHDAPVPLLSISGLDNFSIPRPRMKEMPARNASAPAATPNAGSGPGGAYAGGDFRAAYVPGTALTGTGQSVGLLQFDGYNASDIAAYRTQFGLPNIPLVNIAVDGGVPTPGTGNSEVCLDIEMVMAMAPGVSTIYVYEAPNPSPWVDLLSRMANDNLAKQLSCSWGGGSPDAAAEVIFQQMAAQGQSFFNASGDSDAFSGAIAFPSESPSITQVGGTTLTTNGAGGAFVSETVWNRNNGVGSSGGISPTYSLPTWQQGISMTANKGSTTKRNIPDVALTAESVFVTYNNGGSGSFGGTSCAAPLWAGFMALVNQQAAANGQQPVGFVNPALYNIGRGAASTANFHDTTVGNNFRTGSTTKFPAATGYDLCTGWGSPVGNTLIATLTTVLTPSITGFTPAGGSAGTIVTISGANFSGVTSVAFNGTGAAFTVNSTAQITATAPAGVTGGPITVTTSAGTAASAANFTVIAFSPASAPVGGSVTITGAGFTGASAVNFNGVNATAFTVNSATQITAAVPAGATTGPISLTVPGGVFTSGSSFTVLSGNGAPVVSSFTPASAAVGGSVTITGANFVNVTAVRFNGVAATFTVNSLTQITATVPVPAGGATGFIAVATGYGTGTSAATFTTVATFATFDSATNVPVTAANFTAAGTTVYFTLNFAPATGTALTVVNNTGTGFIGGMFGNLAQGQAVALSYGGVTYQFVANYFGGTGNDLVLQWAGTRPLAWGLGTAGQLGNSGTASSTVPVAVNASGLLAGRTVTALSAGVYHTLALCADGTVFAWGFNNYGQLGNSSYANSATPVAVNAGGALFGRTVIAVAAGQTHSLALCSDGTVAAWGFNGSGQLGSGSAATSSSVPVAVSTGGVLSGKIAVAITAGQNHSLALCSDSTLAAWGSNSDGQLGNGSTAGSSVPVAVGTAGTPLAGKTITGIAAGNFHSLAACADGTLAAWGSNGSAQLGDGTAASSSVPVAVSTAGTPLAGRIVSALAAGASHSLALCSDGTLAAWGGNGAGQLGDGSNTPRPVPVAVRISGTPFAGRTVTALAAGANHSMALCSDGTLAGWGYNGDGQLGTNGAAFSTVPVAVSTSALAAGERFMLVASGQSAFHSLGAVAAPLSPGVVTLAATAVTTSGATLNGTVNPDGYATTAQFQFGAGASYGAATTAQSVGNGTGAVNVSAPVTGLAAHTLCHFTASATNAAGNGTGRDLTFTTLDTAPVANPDTVSNVTGPVIIAVLANDTDADGDALSITAVTQGASGGVTTDGTKVTYTPGASFAASDTFTYTISDGFGGSAIGNVTVNAAPIIAWRAQKFGTNAAYTTPASDNADPNGNGIPNLLEYALNGDPVGTATGRVILPQPSVNAGGTLQLGFTRWLDRTDITLTVQAADLPAGPWINLASSAGGGPFIVATTGATVGETGAGPARAVIVTDLFPLTDPAHPRRFMRVQTTRP